MVDSCEDLIAAYDEKETADGAGAAAGRTTRDAKNPPVLSAAQNAVPRSVSAVDMWQRKLTGVKRVGTSECAIYPRGVLDMLDDDNFVDSPAALLRLLGSFTSTAACPTAALARSVYELILSPSTPVGDFFYAS